MRPTTEVVTTRRKLTTNNNSSSSLPVNTSFPASHRIPEEKGTGDLRLATDNGRLQKNNKLRIIPFVRLDVCHSCSVHHHAATMGVCHTKPEASGVAAKRTTTTDNGNVSAEFSDVMKPSIAADDGLTNSPESPTNVADQPENSDWSSLERIEQRLSSQTEVTESDACRLVDKFAADAFAVLSRLDNVSRPVLWTAYAYLNRMHYENEALMRLLQEDIMPAEVKTSPEALQHVLKHIKASLFSLLRDRAMVAALTAFDAEAINDDIVIDLLQLTGYKWCPRMKIYEGCLAVDISVAKFAVAKALQKQQANVPRIVLEVLRCSEFPQDRLLEKHLRLLPPKYFTLGNIKPALKELLPKSAAANPLMRMRQSHALIFAGLLNVDLSIPGNKEDLAVFARLWRHEPRVLRHLMKRATEEDALQLQAACGGL